MGWFRYERKTCWIVKHYGDGELAQARANRQKQAGELVAYDIRVTSSGQKWNP